MPLPKKEKTNPKKKARQFSRQFPQALILLTGCVNFTKLKNNKNIFTFDNQTKEKILKKQSSYSPKIKDKFSHSKRFILKIQSGCNHFCSYCIVPQRRPYLHSLSIPKTVKTVNQAVKNGYQEVILTGTNLNLYTPGLNPLLKALLDKTKIPLVSFGSIPLNCINSEFINIIKNYKLRIKNYLHIPLQSGSTKILKAMNRPYTRSQIIKTIKNLKLKTKNLNLGTDIIVGFPGETQKDFQQTYTLCQQIGFNKIHVFRYSPRPNTKAKKLFDTLPKIKNSEKICRARLVKSLEI